MAAQHITFYDHLIECLVQRMKENEDDRGRTDCTMPFCEMPTTTGSCIIAIRVRSIDNDDADRHLPRNWYSGEIIIAPDDDFSDDVATWVQAGHKKDVAKMLLTSACEWVSDGKFKEFMPDESIEHNYCVGISCCQYGNAYVSAKNPEEAKEKALALYNQRSIDWHSEEITDMQAEIQ
ncbi:MAG: hypothetical protein RR415_12840 [Ruthenibacterium sp.]